MQHMGSTSARKSSPRKLSRLGDGHAGVQLVGPLGVVMRAGALGLALQAHAVLLLDDAAVIVKGNTSVLRRARVVGHAHRALLVLHDPRVGAPSAGVLLERVELLLACRREGAGAGDLRLQVQEGSELVWRGGRTEHTEHNRSNL